VDHKRRNRTESTYSGCPYADYQSYPRKSRGKNLRFQVGDMVTTSGNLSLGVVVKVAKANSTALLSSTHSSRLVENSPDIYYVYFSNDNISGPYYTSELKSWN
jgi:hypothetical protein